MPTLMLLSSSFIYDAERKYLGYCLEDIRKFLGSCRSMLFVPFAYPNHESYTQKVRDALGSDITITGAHTLSGHDHSDLSRFDVIFCGGGNTFLLLAEMYRRDLVNRIKASVAAGTLYLGSSAGANVACPSIGTTNDMPIVFPPTFEGLGLVPFNINPHYYETPPSFQHMGETRRDRILEFIRENQRTVIGMEEGAILVRIGDELVLRGVRGAKIFTPGAPVTERTVNPGDSLRFLMVPESAAGQV